MGPRWKGKGSEAKAHEDPMSKIVSELKASLSVSDSVGILSGSNVLLEVNTKLAELLDHACFGYRISAAVEKQNDVLRTDGQIDTEEKTSKQWFRLGLEEAFYLCYSLKCLKIEGTDHRAMSEVELWDYMNSQSKCLLDLYKAYSHLRMKNWIVRPGSQYGVDYVAYRHHPALVHSEYAILVFPDAKFCTSDRLRVWSDFHCTLRLCGSVAKTLLVLHVLQHGSGSDFPACLENYSVEEYAIGRWYPEQSREESFNSRLQEK
ncbi:hypothetical protein Droror1_Dr00021817 [Drosera rotundifolia]